MVLGLNDKGQLGDGTVTNRLVPVQVVDNVAPQIKLSYPIGSQGAPQVSKISHPSISWNQMDAALTVFAAYQVHILNEAEQIVLDTGTVNQAVTASGNSWTVDQELPVGVPLKVQVRVKDESVWSNWSEAGWMSIGRSKWRYNRSDNCFESASQRVRKTRWQCMELGNNTNGQLGTVPRRTKRLLCRWKD